MFGDRLLGVVLFGSYARGEAGTDSDVDLLVVVDGRVALSRDLYRQWDGGPIAWEARRVEPHFVHLPQPATVPGGVWAEAALDGIVMFERRMAVSRWLAEVRRRVVSGRLVRRLAHGQPYWAEVA
jgi:predicted nucleotidyltransferase